MIPRRLLIIFLVVLSGSFLLALRPAAANYSGVYPATPFQSMQIQYNLSGANVYEVQEIVFPDHVVLNCYGVGYGEQVSLVAVGIDGNPNRPDVQSHLRAQVVQQPVVVVKDVYFAHPGSGSAEASLTPVVPGPVPETIYANAYLKHMDEITTWQVQVNFIIGSYENLTDPAFLGGPEDNPDTAFDKGEGPGECRARMPRYWVNTSNLNLYLQDRDYSYSGLGPKIDLTRSYNATPVQSGMFGRGWSFAYESTIQTNCAGETFWRKGSGQVLTYKGQLCGATPPVELTPPPGVYDRLIWYGSYFLVIEKKTFFRRRFDQIPGTQSFRLTSITDANGNRVRLGYNGDQTLATVTDAAGRITAFAYDDQKRCVTMSIPDGRTATYGYDAAGNLTTAKDIGGYTSTFTYDAGNYLVSLTAAGKTTSFEYESYPYAPKLKHVKALTDARGKTTTYEMGDTAVKPQLNQKHDPKGNTTIYKSSGDAKTTEVIDPSNLTSTTTYLNGNPVSFTDANGGVSQLEYDSRGNLTKITDPLGNITTNVYSAADNLSSTTNALGNKWRYVYDSRHNVTKMISPKGRTSVFAYDAKGRLISATDPAGNITNYLWNAFGNIKTLTDPLGNVTTYFYDPEGLRLTAVKDPRGNTTRLAYDAIDRVVKITHPDGAFRTFTYDCCALKAVKDENGHTTSLVRDPSLTSPKSRIPWGR
jgi:YD repeat-containing protein